MTFNVLKDETQKIACQSKFIPGDDLLARKIRIDPTTMHETIKYRQETFSEDDTFSTAVFTIPDDKNYQAADSMHIIETCGEIFPHEHT